MDCKICSTANAPVLYHLKYPRAPEDSLNVLRCANCGFTFSEYEAHESRLESDGHGPGGVPDVDPKYTAKFGGRIELYRKVCGPLAGKRVLDIGAGGGAWLMAAQREGAAVEGIELCADCREYAFKENGLRLDHRPVQDPYWQSRAGRYDLVTAWDVFEHVPDPRRFIADCTALVAPHGHLLLTTPVRDTELDNIGALLYHCTGGRAQFVLQSRYSRTHLQIFHSHQLKQLLERGGLRPVYYRHCQEYSFPLERYFANYGCPPTRAAMLGRMARWVLRVLPMENKVMGVFEKSSGEPAPVAAA